jgi:antitoxin HicB
MLSYPVKLIPDGDTFLVTSPDFPELTTFGETQDEALLYAVGAFNEAIAARIAHREDLPSSSKGLPCVTLPTQTALKAMLYQAMRKAGVNKAELVRRMHSHAQQVDRLLDLNHASRIDQIDAALAALGQRLSVQAINAEQPANTEKPKKRAVLRKAKSGVLVRARGKKARRAV